MTTHERDAIQRLVAQYDIEDQLAERDRTGLGDNWTSFYIYDPNNPTAADVVFEGATQLPDNSESAIWVGLQHWTNLLSAIRHLIPDATWCVHVDDHELQWDDTLGKYDLYQ